MLTFEVEPVGPRPPYYGVVVRKHSGGIVVTAWGRAPPFDYWHALATARAVCAALNASPLAVAAAETSANPQQALCDLASRYRREIEGGE